MGQGRLMARMAPLDVVRVGQGPRLVLVHGSATDHTAWMIQLSSPLRDQFELVAVDRSRTATTVEEHAAALAEVGRGIYVGTSFGAVCVLELARLHPELVAGMVLIAPPMVADDNAASAWAGFLAEFDRRIAADGGPAAGEYFLRGVLGDATFERIPAVFAERSTSRWAEIRNDSAALVAYKPRYAELGRMTTPTLLLGGAKSEPFFRATLDALAAALPNARLEIISGAGHMLHVEAARELGKLLIEFAETLRIE
jgi:esterase